MTVQPFPKSPLSEVVFIHDYIQLGFQGEVLSLYNPVVVQLRAIHYQSGEPGFADALVSLIGESVHEVGETDGFVLLLQFEGGAQVRVCKVRGASQPEAYRFNAGSGLIVAQQNV